ncbi:hypothetical protein FO519_002640 [Halicephalobus sp. NKZ332]|nr:hypothetical protein FO519_002640 [Halicephalobus sp. NKZ332]
MGLRFDRVTVFLTLFVIVYYLESTGERYMISAVQSIERQFQIPSKVSGFLMSANDISYIPTVIFISYIGGKGNRAKWMGAGCVLISLAHILTASPNFLFPVKAPRLNLTEIENQLKPSEQLLSDNVTLSELFDFQPLRDRIPAKIREALLLKLNGHSLAFRSPELVHGVQYYNNTDSLYSIDENLISEAMHHVDLILRGKEDESSLVEVLKEFVANREPQHEKDLKIIRRAAIAPFAFCGKLVNDVREAVKDLKCNRQARNYGPLIVIFVALLILGVGRTMPWSLGLPLIDDNIKRKSLPVYFGGISFIKILGPITGFIIGSFCNKIYYTSPTPKGLTPNDPTWIGAWWLGFLLIGSVTFIPSVALFFFPAGDPKSSKISDIPGEKPLNKRKSLKLFDRHRNADSESENSEKSEKLSMKEKVKNFLKSYSEVVRSKIYVGSVVGRIMDVLALKGYMIFLPKYLENHYGLPQYKVQQYMAMFGVFGFACGTLTGGFLTRKFKLNGRRVTFFVLVVSVLNVVVFFSKSFFGCHSIVNTIGQNGVATNFNYTTTCNSPCGCESVSLFPVCDSTGQVFYSPCHAGCRHVKVEDLASYQLEFSDCECAANGIVTKEYCKDDCEIMYKLFFATVVLSAFIAGTGVVPGMLILLRSVPSSTRSISLGLQGFLVSLFGTLPSPMLWGALIDSACLVWDKTCNHRGACIIYDPDTLRMRMHILYCAIRLTACTTDLYVWYHSKDLNILEEEDEKKKPEEVAEKEAAEAMENIPMNQIH